VPLEGIDVLRYALILALALLWGAAAQADSLPSLLQVISPDCHACRFVQAEVNKLRALDAGRLRIDTLDIVKDPEAARRLKVHMVPTLIFLDINGKEMFRHFGQWSAAEIRQKWCELGLELYTGPGT